MNAMTGMRGVAAGKFKVGDRVRRKSLPLTACPVGYEAAVVRVSDNLIWYVDKDGDRVSSNSDLWELSHPTFAVGDRVRIKSGPDNGGYGAVGDVGVVAEIGGASLYMKFETGAEAGESWWVDVEHLEPAPLRIEAGKYYLTRDGRWVGPAYGPEYSAYWAKKVMWINSRSYDDNGREFMDGESRGDLIAEAEAPAPTKGIPAAQVDNLANEYGGGKREPKFKVGDVVDVTYPGAPKWNGRGTITGVKKAYAIVKFPRTGFFDEGGFAFEYLRLVAQATSGNPTLIVALIENGQPKPATRPYIHRSREAATSEAARLAGNHKGSEFGVFELVDTRKVDKPVYEHEWQRLAAEGRVSLAVDALVNLTSLPREAALRAIRLAA